MLERQLAYIDPYVRGVTHAVLHAISAPVADMIRYPNLEKHIAELDGLLDKHALLMVATNHGSHADILVGIKFVHAIRSRFPQIGNFYVPIAASLARGKQGYAAQLLYSEGTLPLLNQENIKPLALVTENDRKKRGLTPDISEIRQLSNAVIEESSAFFDLTEGSVESGRYDYLGNEKGLQEVTNPFLPYIVRKAREIGRKVIVLPAGIDGTNSIVSAESIFFTQHSIGALIQYVLSQKTPVLARAIAGPPYEYSPDRDPEAANQIIMESIASLIPLPKRGYYHPDTRRYQHAVRQFENQLAQKPFSRIRRLLLKSHLLRPPETLHQMAAQLPSAT